MVNIFIAIGVLLIAGMGLDAIGRRTKIPRVTLSILFGLLVGHAGFDLFRFIWYPPLFFFAMIVICTWLFGMFVIPI